DAYDLLRTDEEAGLERTFSLPVGTDLALSGTVRPVPGVDLDKRLDALAPASSLHVVPSSTWGGLPVFGARSLVDGDATTSWLASPDDGQPSIQLSWPDIRTVDSIQVTAPEGPARRPPKVRLQAGLAVPDLDAAP